MLPDFGTDERSDITHVCLCLTLRERHRTRDGDADGAHSSSVFRLLDHKRNRGCIAACVDDDHRGHQNNPGNMAGVSVVATGSVRISSNARSPLMVPAS